MSAAGSSTRILARGFGAASRASPIAGPSRLPLQKSRPRTFATTNTNRTPVTEICARTADPMPSILHALAIMRAVEAKYGQVINIQVPRDPDSLQPTNLIFLTLLEPVELGTKRHIHEIPAPRSELGDKEIFGGPSLADVQAVLSSTPAPRGGNRRGSSTGKVITFEVELRKTARRDRQTRDPTVRKVTPEMIEEDEKILDALDKFGDGFFGGFEGVAAKHRKVLEDRKAQMASSQAQRPDTTRTASAADGRENRDALEPEP